MRILLAVVFIFCAAIIYGRSEVVEIYKKPVPTKGVAIKPPTRMLPPFPLRPNPPPPEEPEELAERAAKRQAQIDFAKARDAYLAKIGFTNMTDTVGLKLATEKMEKIDVVTTTTNTTQKITTTVTAD